MGIKVFKSTTSARSVQYQDSLLSAVVPEYPDVSTFTDDERNNMFRPTRRPEKDNVYVASLAILADTEVELTAVLGAAKLRGAIIHCVEEGIALDRTVTLPAAKRLWKAARRQGSAMRGATKSAETKRERTSEKLVGVKFDLQKDEKTTREILDSVGVKSVNTIRNYFGMSREQMQIRYQAELKRAERRKANVKPKN